MHHPRPEITRALLLFLLALSRFAHSQGSPSVPQPVTGRTQISQLVNTSRTAFRGLNTNGISFQALLVYDWSKSLVSNTDATAGFGRYSFDLMMPVDGEKLFGLKGSAGLVRLKHHMRHFGKTYDDEAQIYSNIDATSRTTLYEAWFQKKFFSENLRLKAGKIDANTEFATVSTAADFLNSSMGFSPTIVEFPTYPEPKFGINLFLGRPSTTYAMGCGIFRTAHGTMSILEPARNWNMGTDENGGRASLGYWRLDGETGGLDGRHAQGTQGFYSVVEQSVWHQTARTERSLWSFLQLGWADSRSSRIMQHIGGGAVLRGLWSGRERDSVGAAATWVRLSSEPGDTDEPTGELTLEAYYKVVISKYLSLIPDFQYLHHPGGRRENTDAPVVTPRLVLSF